MSGRYAFLTSLLEKYIQSLFHLEKKNKSNKFTITLIFRNPNNTYLQAAIKLQPLINKILILGIRESELNLL